MKRFGSCYNSFTCANRQATVEGERRWVKWALRFLELCERPDDPVFLAPQVAATGQAAISRTPGRPEGRSCGVRLHASDVHHFLDGRIQLEDVILGGAFRYHSPQQVADLMRLRRLATGPLDAVLGIAP